MKGITGFRVRRNGDTTPTATSAVRLARPLFDEAAQSRVMAKITGMGEAFYAMSEDQYGEWLNALPQDEFLELMAVMIKADDRVGKREDSRPATSMKRVAHA